MSDFIKKAKQDKEINNGAAIVSSRTDGDLSQHHVQNSQLSEKAQTDNESKLENRFGNKFKYFDSAAEITRIQSKGGGVNKTLAQIQSRLSDVKEKSETVVTKAEENKDFNSGGTVSNAGGGSKFSDTLETNLSQKDQSDTATVINDKIGQSVQTGSNSGSQDAVAIKEEITNNIRNNSIADSTTDSDGLENGGCPDAKTKGSSRLLPNVLTIDLIDKNGDPAPSMAILGDIPCDCYVPLNLPLLGALGKLAKIPGKIAPYVAKLFNEGNSFLGTLNWIGNLGRYRAAVKTHIKTKEIFPLSVGGRTGLTFGQALEKINVVVRKFTDQKKLAKSAEEAARRLISVTNEKIAIAARKKAEALAHKDNLFNQYFGPPDGASTITTMKGQVFNNYLEALEDIISRRGRKTEHPVDIFEAFGNDPHYILDAQSITGKLVEYRGMDGVINHITKVQTELTAELAEASAERIVQRDLFNQAQEQLALAHRKEVKWEREFGNKVTSAEASDVFGLFQSLFGYTFEALAALDPARKKLCIGPGTERNEKTCECECLPGYTECTGSGPAPEFGIPQFNATIPISAAWDFLAPYQSNELKRCYPPCPCNMKRTTGGLMGSNCECSECKDGYTWYAGATCECERTTSMRDHIVNGRPLRNVEIGTCVKNEKVTSNTSLGKTWDSKGCGFKCGPDTDVGNKDRPFGTHHRLSDNLKTEENPDGISPSRHHALYAQGCTYVCDGRDRPEGTPWPPDCVGGFFNTEKCECAPTNCPQYMGNNALVLQDVSYGLDPDTGEPLDYDNFWSVYETRRGGSTSLGLPAGATVTPPGGGQDYGLYIDTASAQGYEFSADPRRYVEWSSSRVRYKAFECDQDGTLGSDITGSVIDLTGVTGPLESCFQETYGEDPKDPPTESMSDTWLGCLSLNYGVAGVSSVDPDIIP